MLTVLTTIKTTTTNNLKCVMDPLSFFFSNRMGVRGLAA